MDPITRKEIFMSAIAKGEKPPIPPLTREEQLLAQHAEREAEGGGSGGGGFATVYYLSGVNNPKWSTTWEDHENDTAQTMTQEAAINIFKAFRSGARVFVYQPLYYLSAGSNSSINEVLYINVAGQDARGTTCILEYTELNTAETDGAGVKRTLWGTAFDSALLK